LLEFGMLKYTIIPESCTKVQSGYPLQKMSNNFAGHFYAAYCTMLQLLTVFLVFVGFASPLQLFLRVFKACIQQTVLLPHIRRALQAVIQPTVHYN